MSFSLSRTFHAGENKKTVRHRRTKKGRKQESEMCDIPTAAMRLPLNGL
jgi:hypothetical protein